MVFKFEPWLFSGTALFSIVPAIIPFVNFYIYKLIIDLVVASFSGQNIDFQRLYFLIGLRVATFFIQDASFRTQDFLHRLLWTKMPIYFNQMVFGKTSSLDIHYFENPKFRDLLEKVRDAAVWRPQQLVEFSFMWMQSLVQVLIAFGAIAKLNIFLVVLVAAVSIPEFLNQTQQSKLSWGVWGNHSPHRKKFWYLSGLLQNSWTIKELKIFRLAKVFLGEVKHLQEKFYSDMSKLAKQNFGFGLTFNALSTAVFVGVEVFVILEAIAKRITVGDINFYTGVVSNFQNGLGGLFRNMNGIFENSLYVKSLFELLDTEPIIKIAEHPKKIDYRKTPLIEIKNISFTYPDSKDKIFSDFSLTINPGEKIALVGENGVGKTTLIKLLARFYDVDSGEILINGINIKNLDLESWYNALGVLFQDFNKYEYPVKDNIAFGKIFDNVGLGKIKEAAKMAGADSMIKSFDEGYDQMLGKTFEKGKDLSGGQWQKIALARAFLRNAPVLILDEPTASLDAKAESEVFNRVEKLSRDKTVIIISHRFSTVRNADKIYVIEKGKIMESGNHQELMAKNGQYATLFKLQAKGYQ
ncbi:MAG: ABC transporter, ATP-binding/permease protein [Candidatus Daviesbacteria bacterium GW2011_GWB1_41_5]|uniref:ABC transporter, ATP-binding/permease protein n=1 Tax=Candidatus Daviesbacteria bacterium GW2011_GWB1_41_5 TaxID=1618429 RepID=A0A0G0WFP0_9BACT|nr:MAG: ABC transporter, ATP-binding/permease protein [Candidatus Daviesbacteria bacterium GW2011_GWB1_41_5]